MEKTLAELAELVGGKVVGDETIKIKRLASLADAQPGDISFLTNPKYRSQLLKTRASAIIAAEVIEGINLTFLIVANPYLAFARIAQVFFSSPPYPKGISKEAIISPHSQIGEDATIFPLVYIGENVVIGERVTLYPGVFIGDGVRIGNEVTIYPNPVRDELLVKRSIGGAFNIRIYDINGNTLVEKKLHNSESVNISNLPTGLYFLSINQKTVYKLIKY